VPPRVTDVPGQIVSFAPAFTVRTVLFAAAENKKTEMMIDKTAFKSMRMRVIGKDNV